MRAALMLCGYALVVACLVPAPLATLTGHGVSVRLGLAAWLASMASALAAAGLALQFLFQTAQAGWPHLTEALCRSVAGGACTPAIYRSALYELGVAAVTTVAALVAVIAACRCGRRAQRARRQSRAHARAARIVGRALPGTGAVVLDDPRPAAYCVPGRPAAIVVTSGALSVLDEPQLGAVLAHERAHLAGRHQALVVFARGLAAVFPGVPLFSLGVSEVRRLAEMCADDAAARGGGRATLVAALFAIVTGSPVPGGVAGGTAPGTGLAAAAYAVPARVERLLSPAARKRRVAFGLVLATAVALLVLLPCALAVLAW